MVTKRCRIDAIEIDMDSNAYLEESRSSFKPVSLIYQQYQRKTKHYPMTEALTIKLQL
jgi:hypothetical protein